MVTVGGVASNGMSFTVGSTALPAPWLATDIGSPAVGGSTTYASGTFTINGAGADIWGTADQFHFAYRSLTGDGEIVARVASLQNTHAWAKAGVMMRETLTGASRYAIAAVSVANGLAFQRRLTTGGSTSITGGGAGTAPYWVRLVRSGSTFSAYRSATGTSWTFIGSDTISMAATVYVGLAVTSHNVSTPATATFTDAVVTTPGAPSPSITSLTPTSGVVGTPVTITGANFGATQGTSTVRFNGTVAAPTSWSGTSLVAPVPSGATSGNVVVTVGGVASNGMSFTVGSTTPSITSLTPTSGTVGTPVTIAGANFGATQGTSTVRFNGTVAVPTSWSGTSLVAPVPSGATSGNVVVTVGGVASNGMSFTVGTTGLPSPWLATDIGSPAVGGSTTYASGTFTVNGAGADIWGTADQFHFAYQPLTGDGEIVARVASLQNTHAWAKAGVMMRETLTGASRYALAAVSVGNGLAFQRRVTTGGSTSITSGGAGTAPYWVRLVRSGSTFSAYRSATGTSWTLIGSDTISMAATVYVGLAVTSHNVSTRATATFTDAAVFGTTGLPAPWLATDIGSPAVGGSATYTSGTFTINGAGADIWGTANQFHFAYRSLTGDGEIVARVASLQNTHAWAKAGVMMRETLTGPSRYAFTAVSVANGLAFQRRLATGGSTAITGGGAGAAPYWVRLVRSGSTFSAYRSTTGTSWTLIGSETIPMAATVYVGLAVTSHSASTLATATFTGIAP